MQTMAFIYLILFFKKKPLYPQVTAIYLWGKYYNAFT